MFDQTAPAPRATFCAIAVAGLLSVGATGGAVAADTPPDPRLGALFSVEKSALGAVEPGHVARILTAPAEAAPVHKLTEDGLACLARALYYEARGEGEVGMRAVAEVVLNRAEDGGFPDTVCAVVEQGAGNGRGCQFSFVCDGSENRRLERRAWNRAKALAREMAGGAPRALTDGATHFHTVAVNPRWARVYELTAVIGAHRFYRRPLEVAAN